MFLFCVLIIVICAIVIVIYFKSLKKINNKTEWELIGEIANIFIYPIDGGPALNVRRALCTKSGLRNALMDDRSIIAYSASSKSAVLNLDNAKIFENRDYLFTQLKNATALFNRQMENSSRKPAEIKIDYLGDPIKVVPFPISVPLATLLGCLTNEVQLCFFEARKRTQFMKIMRKKLKKIQNIIVNGFASNYSNFTLIDTKSFQELRNTIGREASTQISFSPQLIVNGQIPSNATALRIGDASSKIKFTNIIPCNIVLPTVEKILQHFCLFGFNMELKDQALNSSVSKTKNGVMIHLGDKVYVKSSISHAF